MGVAWAATGVETRPDPNELGIVIDSAGVVVVDPQGLCELGWDTVSGKLLPASPGTQPQASWSVLNRGVVPVATLHRGT